MNQSKSWREEYSDAVQLHSLQVSNYSLTKFILLYNLIYFQAQAESFLQIIVQLFFMILLVLLGAGTIVAGVGSAQNFFDKVCKYWFLCSIKI